MTITSDAYGHAVTFSTDGTTDTYEVGGSRPYMFANKTADNVVSLSIAIQENLLIFNAVLSDFISTKYPLDVRSRLTILYLATQTNILLVNRLAYLNKLLTWVNSISAYAATYIATLQGQSDPAVVVTLKFDASQFSADPGVTVLGAMSIAN